MNARELMIRVFASGGVQAAQQLALPGDAAQKSAKQMQSAANQSDMASQKVTRSASGMRLAFGAVATAAALMGAKVQTGGDTAARGVTSLTQSATKAEVAFAKATSQADRLNRAAEHFKDRSWGLGLKAAAQEAQHLSDQLLQAEMRARRASSAMATIKGPGSAATKVAAFGTLMDAAGEEAAKYNTARNFGAGMLAASGAGGYALSRGVGLAGQKELQLKAIEVFTKSKGGAQDVYKTADDMSTNSVDSLRGLVQASKTLSKNRIFDRRYLKASDDLAAANLDEGVGTNDVALQFGRLKNGQTGEAFERFAEMGVTREDLKAKGLKFSASGEYEDKSAAGIEKAIDAVTKVIEEKFGNLSKKMATETMTGALSNLGDATDRVVTSISEELVPTVTAGARLLTSFAGWFANLPGPVKKCIAWGGVFTVALIGLGGLFLTGAALAGQASIGLMAMNGQLALTGPLAGQSSGGLLGLATKALPALGAATLTTVATIAGALAVLAFAAFVAKKYYDEMQKPTETVRDGRTGEESAQDATTAQKIRDSVAAANADKNINTRGKIAVLAAASKKMGDAGFTDEAIALANERAKLAKQTPTGDAKGADKYLSQINGLMGNFRISQQAVTVPKTKSPEDEVKEKTSALEKQAQSMMAQQPATMAGAFGPQSTSGMGTGVDGLAVTGGLAGGASGDSIRDLELRQLNGEDVKDQMKWARFNEKWRNKDAAAARKAEREAEKGQNSKAIEAGIAALGDGSDDVGKIPELQKRLRAERRGKNSTEVAILSERITRAQEAARDMRKDESEQKRAESAQKREDAKARRWWLEDQKAILDAKVRSHQMTKEQAAAQMKALRRQSEGGSFGSGTGIGGNAADNGMVPISENEKPWIGYTRHQLDGMPQADAYRWINKQSAYFERGGFDNEAEMSAYQRAYMERYGKADFKNSMFPGGLTRQNQVATLKPGALSSAANPISFGNSGDGSAAPASSNRPQNENETETLTVRGVQQRIQQGAKTIIRTIVPDLVLEDSFAHAVAGVRRRS